LEVERENVQKIIRNWKNVWKRGPIEYQIANRELQRESKDHKEAESQKKLRLRRYGKEKNCIGPLVGKFK